VFAIFAFSFTHPRTARDWRLAASSSAFRSACSRPLPLEDQDLLPGSEPVSSVPGSA
jgi:hypothetical protein